MKDWVIPYLKNEGMNYSEQKFEEIKKVNFDCLKNNKEYQGTFLRISELLMKKLNYKFGETQEGKYFLITFSSVLADLQRQYFDQLCNMKNILFIYKAIALPGYIRHLTCSKNINIDNGEIIDIIVFTYEIPLMKRLVTRQMIAHELIHVIENLSREQEALVHQKTREWGFNEELDEANKYGRRRDTLMLIQKIISRIGLVGIK